jgi:hypothetical protein
VKFFLGRPCFRFGGWSARLGCWLADGLSLLGRPRLGLGEDCTTTGCMLSSGDTNVIGGAICEITGLANNSDDCEGDVGGGVVAKGSVEAYDDGGRNSKFEEYVPYGMTVF